MELCKYNYRCKKSLKARERILHNLAQLLVIGGASLDTLHLKDQTVTSAGGAGMYTTMAAVRSGVQASMFAPKPDKMPEELAKVASRLNEWIGPIIPAERLPHFEIEHKGEKANYLRTFIGAEAELTFNQLPADLSKYDIIHLTPLGESNRQQEFLRVCRERGARRISAGTYLCTIRENPEIVRQSMALTDVFFMNEEEACLLFGSLKQVKTIAGKIIFVTLGAHGALVVQGDEQTRITAVTAKVLDPTGAGDSFCGAALAGMMLGLHPVMAAYKAVALAAEEIESIGPAALLLDAASPDPKLDVRVRINHEQIVLVSEVIKQFEGASPFDFVGKDFPNEGDPQTVNYFFATILQQFSFWDTKNDIYDHPLVAPIDGETLKGSAYLFRAFRKSLESDPNFYNPQRQAQLTQADAVKLFKADDDSDPMPSLELHLALAQKYGADMLALGKIPQQVLEAAKASSTPLHTFLASLDQISGYKEDPLRKKSNLLALVLNQRPEHFLSFGEGEAVPPVIDYHTMRGCLRMGLIDVLDDKLRKKISDRRIVAPDEEWAVRYACYLAVEEVVRVSGKSLGAVDWYFFAYSRLHCPEMTTPVCLECAVNPVCARRVELFQPVLRTTFY